MTSPCVICRHGKSTYVLLLELGQICIQPNDSQMFEHTPGKGRLPQVTNVAAVRHGKFRHIFGAQTFMILALVSSGAFTQKAPQAARQPSITVRAGKDTISVGTVPEVCTSRFSPI